VTAIMWTVAAWLGLNVGVLIVLLALQLLGGLRRILAGLGAHDDRASARSPREQASPGGFPAVFE
jgi:hypothetical protein